MLILTLGLLSCRVFARPEPQYGPEHNAIREQVGLPIIPANWEAESVHSGECTWVNPERTQKYDARIPVHWSKYLNYRTGDLIYETDTYFGSEDYVLEGEGTFREKLRITYYYQVDDYDYKGRLGWDVTLYNQEHPSGKNISLEEAKTVLKNEYEITVPIQTESGYRKPCKWESYLAFSPKHLGNLQEWNASATPSPSSTKAGSVDAE